MILVSVAKWTKLRSERHSPARDPHGRETHVHNQEHQD
jgi:hypothetical protein